MMNSTKDLTLDVSNMYINIMNRAVALRNSIVYIHYLTTKFYRCR